MENNRFDETTTSLLDTPIAPSRVLSRVLGRVLGRALGAGTRTRIPLTAVAARRTFLLAFTEKLWILGLEGNGDAAVLVRLAGVGLGAGAVVFDLRIPASQEHDDDKEDRKSMGIGVGVGVGLKDERKRRRMYSHNTHSDPCPPTRTCPSASARTSQPATSHRRSRRPASGTRPRRHSAWCTLRQSCTVAEVSLTSLSR